ncbi:MAG: hypothetical protein L3J37_12080 [Rhodobacteraceae bacterium]|nr:hypothetical protein [Paracoccaceae bacterium]
MRRSPTRTGGYEVNGVLGTRPYHLKRQLETAFEKGISPFLLISYEAGFPRKIYESGELTQGFKNSDFFTEVLITRRFVNWLPSFIRLIRLIERDTPPEALGISHHITFEMNRYKAHLIEAADSPHLVICYDDWFASESYRCARLADLGLEVLDNTLGKMQRYGAGSSFSGMAIEVSELDIANRWKTMQQDPYAQTFLELARQDRDFMAVLSESFPDDPDIVARLCAP